MTILYYRSVRTTVRSIYTWRSKFQYSIKWMLKAGSIPLPITAKNPVTYKSEELLKAE